LEECYDPAPPSETEERATWHTVIVIV
jgi:hypothetical protein